MHVSVLTQRTAVIPVEGSPVPSNVGTVACQSGIAITIHGAIVPSSVGVVVLVHQSRVMITAKDSVTSSDTGIGIIITVGVALIIARETWPSVVDCPAMIAEMTPLVTIYMVVNVILV